uniref:Uncharacterized protein n=1 Tax=Chromera velia CCMP2878 TaxID=1169474 RepID=A0A0G4I681_9ALVE|eukprot:Cvel_11295.t1-p1 / transcript=Cvel_11295.t1 / gene=Cvel_11295 / organism=Chromera_velia_CCMP2878 / gene_product=Ribosome maturation factor RimP, putative / transcript_product=Ribosome maturation factor RimP, putative / location=Cvel_scaffold705:47236-50645(+) / protein_length=342 / sequence_SO=supercontig / SO=protein_coding / is_pseudo=false
MGRLQPSAAHVKQRSTVLLGKKSAAKGRKKSSESLSGKPLQPADLDFDPFNAPPVSAEDFVEIDFDDEDDADQDEGEEDVEGDGDEGDGDGDGGEIEDADWDDYFGETESELEKAHARLLGSIEANDFMEDENNLDEETRALLARLRNGELIGAEANPGKLEVARRYFDCEMQLTSLLEAGVSGRELWKPTLEALVKRTVDEFGLRLHALKWRGDGFLMEVANGENKVVDSSSLEECHKVVYAAVEALDSERGWDMLSKFDMVSSSTGLSDVLDKTKRMDAFKGFAVAVSLSEEHRGRMRWVGPLLEKTDKALVLNNRGKRCSIPLSKVAEVRLTKDSHIMW